MPCMVLPDGVMFLRRLKFLHFFFILHKTTDKKKKMGFFLLRETPLGHQEKCTRLSLWFPSFILFLLRNILHIFPLHAKKGGRGFVIAPQC